MPDFTRRSPGFGPKLALLALALAAACNDTVPSSAPPTSRFYFPTGITLQHDPSGCTPGVGSCTTRLVVASSNFDLQYDLATGGTLSAVDVGATLARGGAEPLAPVLLGGEAGVAHMGSFAGEVAMVDESTCPGWESGAFAGGPHAPLALVTSRADVALYQMTIDPIAGLTCGAGCVLPLTGAADPYGVTVVCGTFPPVDANGVGIPGAAPVPQALAFVTYLRASVLEGFVSRLDLTGRDPHILLDLQTSPTHATAFDPATARLYVTSRFATVGLAPLRWFSLASPGQLADLFDLGTVVRGAEMRSLALSTPQPAAPALTTRGYLATRIYSVDSASVLTVRPSTDIGGALAVLDLAEQPAGTPAMSVLRVVPLGLGPNEVRVLGGADYQRAGLRDLVAVTSTDDGVVTLYDDEAGEVTRIFDVCGPSGGDPSAPDPCPAGRPSMGSRPFGLAVEPFVRADGAKLARLYVGSFDRSWINVVEIDPLHPARHEVNGTALRWDRIGAERPEAPLP